MPEVSNITLHVMWTDPDDWHNLAPIELREFILEKVISNLLRNLTSIDELTHENFAEYTELAQWIESQSFIMANSRGKYYRLLTEYLNKTQEELKEGFDQYKAERKRNFYLIERPNTKPWHENFAADLRKIIISTFVDEIIPTIERPSLFDESERRLLMLASRSEAIAYAACNSRIEYYELLGKKIAQIKSRIDTLLRARGRRGPGITSSAIDMISQPNDQGFNF